MPFEVAAVVEALVGGVEPVVSRSPMGPPLSLDGSPLANRSAITK